MDGQQAAEDLQDIQEEPEGSQTGVKTELSPTPIPLTPDLILRAAGIVSAGNFKGTAAAYLGVHDETLRLWLRKGARDRRGGYVSRGTLTNSGEAESLYAQLHRAVEHALATNEMRAVYKIQHASEGGDLIEERTSRHKDGGETTVKRYSQPDWRAAAWWLERYYRNRWGQESDRVYDHDRREVDDDGADPRAIEASFLPDPRRRLALRVAASRMLEREKERMAALAKDGKAAENVERTGGFQGRDQGGATEMQPTDVGDESISDLGLGAENGLQGDCGGNSEGGTAPGGGSDLQSDVATVGADTLVVDDSELATEEKTHAHAFAASDLETDDAATERPEVESGPVIDWEDEEKAD